MVKDVFTEYGQRLENRRKDHTYLTAVPDIGGGDCHGGRRDWRNEYYAGVGDRTNPEIGIRMAVGARASDVLQQFLIEAVLVCTVGGALGVALSLMIAFILQLFLPGWEIGFSPLALLTAFLCSTLTGVLFGWLPARNAARLDPVDATARE